MQQSLNSSKTRKLEAILPFRSLFLHAWDLQDEGTDYVMDWMAKTELNTMCMAGTYHSGWFVHPHSPKRRAYMAEGNASYFHPHDELYRRTSLRPNVAVMAQRTNWLAEAGKRLEKFGLRLVSWTIGAHNTLQGLARPQLTQQNVYGDRLPHALCFANDDVHNYLKALCRDLATNYPLWGIQLESFGWMGFNHGHHHERDLVGLTSLEQQLMGLCVCEACVTKANRAGVETQAVKEIVKRTLDDTFREAPQRPKNHPRAMAELENNSPELKKFNAWRKTFSNRLISEIKNESLKDTECRLLLQAPFEPDLAGVADGFGCGAYKETPETTQKICRESRAVMPENWNGLLQCFIQLGMGVPESEEQLQKIIAAVRAGGCNGINFYNLSEAPPKMLQWLSHVLPRFAK